MENKKNQRLHGMLGFAKRAGKVIIGTELVCRAMPKGEVKLVVISAASSLPTKKKLTVKSDFYKIPWVEADIDTDSLGHILGKSSSVAAVAITEERFAEEISKATVSD